MMSVTKAYNQMIPDYRLHQAHPQVMQQNLSTVTLVYREWVKMQS
jgi:hypothetical protein